MDSETLEILRGNPEIDRVASILIKSLQRATVEIRHGKVIIEVPFYGGHIRSPKEIHVTTHNS